MPKKDTHIIDLIGNTPLLHMRGLSQKTGCRILAKAEFSNPGQSVKDRAALRIIQNAMKKGKLEPGGTLIEGTAGNTGIGMAMVAKAYGIKAVIVIPQTQSQEKKDAIRMCGAQMIEVPAVSIKDPNHYVAYSGALAQKTHGAFWGNQFDNRDNGEAHFETTGPEIWRETNGRIDGFVCSVGTGGTISGVGRYLKEQNASIQVVCCDPTGASLYSYYTRGVLESLGEGSITEGIGQSRITQNLQDAPVDTAYQISDKSMLLTLYDVVIDTGIFFGGSSGINLAGAVKMAQDMGPGHTIVTMLCDYGNRYTQKLFNKDFLKEHSLPTLDDWLKSR